MIRVSIRDTARRFGARAAGQVARTGRRSEDATVWIDERDYQTKTGQPPQGTTPSPARPPSTKPPKAAADKARCLAAEQPGPGRVLHRAIKRLTGQDVTPGCKCCRRIEVMNEKGWAWCIANRGTILGWLREEGEKRGIEMSDATVRAALAAAWREWRKPV